MHLNTKISGVDSCWRKKVFYCCLQIYHRRRINNKINDDDTSDDSDSDSDGEGLPNRTKFDTKVERYIKKEKLFDFSPVSNLSQTDHNELSGAKSLDLDK